MPREYLIGCDLGAPHEPSGVVVVERSESLGDWNAARKRFDVRVSYLVTAATRVERSGGYGRVASEVARLTTPAEAGARAALVVNVGTSGMAALDPMRALGLRPVAVHVTGPIGGKPARPSYVLAPAELTATLAAVFEQKRLVVDVDHYPGLAEQLRAKVKDEDKAGLELKRALGLAAWWGDRWRARLAQPVPPRSAMVERLERACLPPTFSEMVAANRR